MGRSLESKYAVALNSESQYQVETYLERHPEVEVFVVPKEELYEFIAAKLDPSAQVKLTYHDGGYIDVSPRFFLGEANDLHTQIHYTNETEQTVIAESNASFCSLILLFDNEGNAFRIHEPFVGAYTYGYQNVEECYEDILRIPALLESLHDSKAVFVTGTNVLTELQQRFQENLRAIIGNDVPLLAFFAQFMPEDEDTVMDTSNPIPQVSTEAFNGVVFIPRDLSVDKKNQVIVYTTNLWWASTL